MYDIPNTLQSLKADIEAGVMTIEEAAEELHRAGWTTYIDLEKTARLLDLKS